MGRNQHIEQRGGGGGGSQCRAPHHPVPSKISRRCRACTRRGAAGLGEGAVASCQCPHSPSRDSGAHGWMGQQDAPGCEMRSGLSTGGRAHGSTAECITGGKVMTWAGTPDSTAEMVASSVGGGCESGPRRRTGTCLGDGTCAASRMPPPQNAPRNKAACVWAQGPVVLNTEQLHVCLCSPTPLLAL